MDESVDPCTDFYRFVCGNYIKETVIPDHKSHTGTFSLVADTLNMRLRRIFESKPRASEPRAYENVRKLYQSCMDTEGVERSSVSELMVILQELGG